MVALGLESERKLALIEEMAGVGHWRFDLATRKVTWSAQVYRIHGVEPNAFDPNLDTVVDAYHPDDRRKLLELIECAVVSGQGYHFLLRLQRISDRATRIVTARAEVERDESGASIALFGVFQDVTEREQARQRVEDALRAAELARIQALASESRFRALAENGADVTMQTDLAGLLVYVSPAIERLAGYTPAEMIGRETMSFVHPEDRPGIRRSVDDTLRSKGTIPLERIECRMICKDGDIIWLETSPALLLDPESGRMIAITDIVRDITRRKLAEEGASRAADEARRAHEAVEARLAAEEISRAKSEFIANVSDELKTPLNAIIGYTELLLESAQAQGREVDAIDNQRVLDAATQLLSMVNQVLRLSSIDAGRHKVNLDEFNMNALIDDAVVAMRLAARESGNRIEVEPCEESGLWICDGLKLDQCLRNLLSNGVKFTRDGAITVRSDRDFVHGRSWLRIEVLDTGVGIEPSQLDALFLPFGATASGAPRGEGIGLGLAVTRQMARLMGGDVTVASAPGRGSHFTLRVPAEFLPQEEARLQGAGGSN